MSSSRLHPQRHVAIAATVLFCAAGGGLIAADGGRPTGRPIEFSGPNDAASTTNANLLSAPPPNQFNLRDRKAKPDSLDFRNTRPERPSMPSGGFVIHRPRNEQKSNPSTEDLINSYIARQILKTPGPGLDGTEEPDSLMGYYEELLAARGNTNAIAGSPLSPLKGGWDGSRNRAINDDTEPDSPDGSPRSLNTFLNSGRDDFAFGPRPTGTSDLFGTRPNPVAALETMRSQKMQSEQIQAYRDLWAPPPVAGAISPPASPVGAGSSSGTPFAGPGVGGAFAATPGAAYSSLLPTLPAGPAGATPTPGQASFLATPPPAVSPVRLPPPQPVFSAPQRRF